MLKLPRSISFQDAVNSRAVSGRQTELIACLRIPCWLTLPNIQTDWCLSPPEQWRYCQSGGIAEIPQPGRCHPTEGTTSIELRKEHSKEVCQTNKYTLTWTTPTVNFSRVKLEF